MKQFKVSVHKCGTKEWHEMSGSAFIEDNINYNVLNVIYKVSYISRICYKMLDFA